MINNLISIIVPVYNVEEFLPVCLDSIINQTYSEIEIILIDDGSTDSSGDICDRYAKIDERVKVVHKDNGGLSDARNVGLQVAKGEYIGFVDSDDYLELDMYETLINILRDCGVLVSYARHDHVGCTPDDTPKQTGVVEVLDYEECLKSVVLEGYEKKRYMTSSVWAGLYQREIVEGMEFPVGTYCEDVLYTAKVILRARKVAYINKALYHYRVRSGSITQYELGFDRKFVMDRLDQKRLRIDFLEKEHISSAAVIDKIRAYNDISKQYIDYYIDSGVRRLLKIEMKISKSPLRLIIGADIPILLKIRSLLWRSCPTIIGAVKSKIGLIV